MPHEDNEDAIAAYYSRLITARGATAPPPAPAVPGSLVTFTSAELAELSEQTLRAVQALHTPYADGNECAGCARYYRAGRWPWPCPSRRAADTELNRRGANR